MNGISEVEYCTMDNKFLDIFKTRIKPFFCDLDLFFNFFRYLASFL